jgi:hypothetical protein
MAARGVRATNKIIEAAIDWYNVLKGIPDLWERQQESQSLLATV